MMFSSSEMQKRAELAKMESQVEDSIKPGQLISSDAEEDDSDDADFAETPANQAALQNTTAEDKMSSFETPLQNSTPEDKKTQLSSVETPLQNTTAENETLSVQTPLPNSAAENEMSSFETSLQNTTAENETLNPKTEEKHSTASSVNVEVDLHQDVASDNAIAESCACPSSEECHNNTTGTPSSCDEILPKQGDVISSTQSEHELESNVTVTHFDLELFPKD